MRRLRYLADAQEDILNILDYIESESGNVAIARGFVSRIRQRCRKLAQLPGHMGRPRYDLGPSLRSIAFQGYIIFFRYEGDVLEIVSVLESHRDAASYFEDES